MSERYTKHKRIALYGRLLDKYDWRLQVIVAIEEMAELSQELTTVLRHDGVIDKGRIVEELADCFIMYEQLGMIFSVQEEEFGEMVNKKMEWVEVLTQK